MALGGKRPGAGRKKGSSTKEALAFRELLLKRVDEAKGELIDALIAKAKGGDVQALKEINERTLGKVSQPLSNDVDNPLILQWSLPYPTPQGIGPKPSTAPKGAG